MKPKPISKTQCLVALKKTKSIKAASRYLGCSYQHLRKYTMLYIDEDTGKTLHEVYKNQAGKGIPKYLKNRKNGKEPNLMDIIEGRVPPTSFHVDKLKLRLFEEGYLHETCYNCGFSERRVSDYKVPLLIHFKDENKNNWKLNNLEMMCYNCYFLYIKDVFEAKQVQMIETPTTQLNGVKEVTWELDDYQKGRLEELGLMKKDKPTFGEDAYDYVSWQNK